MGTGHKKMATKPLFGRNGRLRLLGTGSAMAAAIVLAGLASGGASASASAQAMPPALQSQPAPNVRQLPTPIASEFFTNTRGVTLEVPVVPQRPENIPSIRISAPKAPEFIPPVKISAPAEVVAPPPAATPTPTPTPQPADVARTTAAEPSSGGVEFVQTTAFNTTVDGINVQAQAAFDNAEVDYTPGVASDVVELLASQAIINWTTFGAGAAGTDVVFLGSGGNLEFTSAQSDFTVLNRIFTPGFDSAIRIDGAVTSTILGGAVTGGNVWFYSAGGIVVGPGASFDVGGLVLSTSQLDTIDAGGSQMNFLGASNPNSAIVIENGATISANNTNSYVAIVGPSIRQGGAVQVNGSVAYVAAEQAQLTINNGLFDIAVSLGSEHANGIVHTGSTGGAASQAFVDPVTGNVTNADPHAIYMVAVPKNNAMTMLVGGTVGFDAATSASRTDNGTIILSAGAGVSTDGVLANPNITIESETAVANGSIAIENATFTSDIEVYASDTVDLTQGGLNTQTLEYARLSSGGDARGDYDLNISADNSIIIGVTDNSTIDIAGDLILNAGAGQNTGGSVTVLADNAPGSATGGPPPPPAPVDAGQINIGGNLIIDASGSGLDDFATFRNNGGTGIGQDAVGGTVNLTVQNDAAINVAGSLRLDASGQGGKGENQNGASAGGDVTLSITSGTLDVTGALILTAAGRAAQDGKDSAGGTGALGSTSTGGSVTFDLAGGQVTAGSLALDASADGTVGSDTSVPHVSTATGGSIDLDVTAGTHTFGTVFLNAGAEAGSNFDASGNPIASDAIRGLVDVAINGAGTGFQVTNDLSIIASTRGGVADTGSTVVNIAATGTGSTGGLVVGGELRVEAIAADGDANADNYAGSINILSDNSNITFGSMNLLTVASPSGAQSFGVGGGSDFIAGDITLTAIGGGVLSGGAGTFQADATGVDLAGGNGTGGNILLEANNGTITFAGGVSANSTGLGGTGVDAVGDAGFGRGGSVRFALSGVSGAMNFTDLSVASDGVVFSFGEGGFGGFNGFDGDGGTGVAGSVTFDLTGGTFAAGNVSVSADGQGGPGGDSTNLADTVLMNGGVILGGISGGIINGFTSAPGLDPAAGQTAFMGGAGSNGLPKAGRGGDGTGGTVVFRLDGTIATMASLEVSADGVAGSGGSASFDNNNRGGDGGDAIGGSATFDAISGSLTVTNDLTVSANGGAEFSRGNGGFGEDTEGGLGGSATGGSAIFNLTGTAAINAGNVIVDASAFAGSGGGSGPSFGSGGGSAGYAGDGGTATAGAAEFNNTSGSITFGTLTVSANGDGGDGGDSFGLSTGLATGNGGIGGDGIGGTATINLNQDDTTNPTYVIEATGQGGQGGEGLNGNNGGSATGGTARLNVNNVSVDLNSISINSSAVGGEGGFSDGETGNGGNGGSALGGSSILDVNGVNGVLQTNLATTLLANAQGGTGSDGSTPFSGGFAPGDGGVGGDGTAGLIQIIARDGGQLNLLVDGGINAIGRGGVGGSGGSDFSGSLTGDGGDAGNATGGRIEVLAETSGIVNVAAVSTDAQFNASAFGALGGNGGTGSSGALGNLGANGSAVGGAIVFSADGADTAISVTNGLTAIANGQAAADTRIMSIGGDASGGSVTLTAANSASIGVTGGAILDATAIGGSGLIRGGSATGGTTSISATSGTLVLNSVQFNVSAVGGNANVAASVGGMGGGANGGVAGIATDENSTLTLNDITVFGSAAGGASGLGAGGVIAASGGDAVGADVSIDLAGSVSGLSNLTIETTASGGVGGTGGSGGSAGNGGTAQAGTAAINITGSGPLLPTLSDVSLDVSAFGGAGGIGAAGDSVQEGGSGGVGGNGIGGTITFAISGTGATLDFDPAQFVLNGESFGGAGGDGGSNFLGGMAGNGGEGGGGTGGNVTIQANSGTEITLTGGGSIPASLSSNGTGGAGGAGGDIDMVAGGIAGDGGAGGTGQGGSPTLRAIGGTIAGADVELTAVGFGGNGGIGGGDGTVQIGEVGAAGDGVGGTPLLEALEGSPGILNFGSLTVLANGSAGFGGNAIGGLVTIRDLSTDPLGVIRFGSLNVDASGTSSIAGGGFTMIGGSGATAVNGSVAINVAGDIIYNFDADGQMIVGGTTLLDAGGNILITHTNNAGNIASIDSVGRFDAQADGNFTSSDNAIINSADQVTLDILGNVTAHDVRGVGTVQINAGQNVTLNNATVSGAPTSFPVGAGVIVTSGLLVQAGLQTGGSIDEFDPNFNARFTGDVTSTGFIAVNAGGNTTFANGANVISDNGITVQTGDDIIVEAGARIEAGANPVAGPSAANPFSNFNNLVLAAGELINTGQLLGTGITPIASIVAAGDIVANDFAVVLTANAVDGLSGSIDASSVAIDIVDAPNSGVVQSNDNGLLSSNCLEGSVCLGSITSDNVIAVGQASNNDVISLTVEQATIAADDILITIRDNIVMGTDGIPTQLAASNQFLITSLTGDIDLRDAVVTSDQILVSAAGSLLGNGSLISANDIGIDVGQNINLALIDTDGQLTTVAGVGGAAEFQYSVPGSINVGRYDLGNLNVRIVAGGDNSFGAININGTRGITLIASNTATGDVFLGTATGANDIDLIGDNVGFTDLSAARFLRLDAQAGGITGGSLTSASLMELDGSFINVGDLNSSSTVAVAATAGDVTVGNVVSTFVSSFSATGNVTTGDITSGGLGASLAADGNIVTGAIVTSGGVADIRLNAGGTIDYGSINGSRLINITGGTVNGGNITGASQVDIEGTSLNLGDVQSVGGFALLESTVGDIVAGDVTADAFGVNINSAANVDVGVLTGRGITLVAADNATVDEANSGVGLSFNVGGNLAAGNLDAQSMNVTVGADAAIASASSNGLLTINVGGALTGGEFTAASLNRLTAASFDIDTAESTAQSVTVNATAGSAIVDTVASRFGTTVTATDDVTVGNATTGSFLTLRGDNVTLNAGDVSASLVLDATDGNVAGTGTVTVGGLINLDATGNIGFGTLDAQGSTFNADAGGDITFDAASATTTMTFNAVGDITFNSAASGGNMAFDADGNIFGGAINTAGTGDTTFIAGSAVELDDIVARILTVSAGTDLTIGNVDAIGRNIRGIAINLDAAGTATFGNLISGRGIDIDAAIINGGNVTSENGVSFTANSVTLGDVAILDIGVVTIDAVAGNIVTGDLTSDTFGIFLDATGSITTDNLLVNGTSNSSDIDVIAGTDADIGDVAAGNRLIIDVGGNLTAGNLSSIVTSPATLVTVGGDADIASFDATIGAGTITVDGALTGGAFSADNVLTINAGTVNIDSATSVGQTVTVDANIGDAIIGSTSSARDTLLTAVGLAQVGNAISNENFTIRGANAVLNSGTIADDLVWEATNGNIDGNGAITVGGAIDLDASGNIGFGSLEAQNGNFAVDAGGTLDFTGATASGDILFSAMGAITGGNLNAGGTLDLNGGNIAIGDASGTNIAFTSAANILFDSITSPNAITLSALNGTIGANAGNGDIDSDDDVTLTAESITVGDLTSGGSVTANATAGDASFGTIDATTTIAITATGQSTVANALSGGDTTISGGSVALSDGTIGGNLTLDATAGNIFRQDTVTVSGAIDLDATGFVAIGRLDAQGGDFTADAGGDIFVTSAMSSGDILFTAGGTLLGGDYVADGAVTLDAVQVTIDDVNATDITLISDTDIAFSTLTSTGSTTLTAVDGLIVAIRGVGDIDSGGNLSITAQSLDLGDLTTGGAFVANATTGDASFGTIDAATDITITAAGTPSLVNAISGGSTTITGASVTFNNGSIGGDLSLTANTGNIDGNGSVTVAGGIAMDAAGSASFGDLDAQGGDFIVDADGDIAFGTATASGNVDFTSGGTVGGSGIVANGTIDVSATEIDIINLSGTDVTLMARDIAFGTVTASGAAVLNAIETVRGGTINADTSITLRGDDGITLDGATAGTDFDIATVGTFTVGAAGLVAGSDIVIDGNVVNLATSSAAGLIDVTGTEINFDALTAGTTITLETVDPSLLSSPVAGTGDINGGALTAGLGQSRVAAFRNAVTGPIVVAGSLSMEAGEDLTVTTVDVQGGEISAVAGQNIVYDTIDAAQSVSLAAGANVTGTAIDAAQNISISSSGNGAVTADIFTADGDILVSTGGLMAVDEIDVQGSATINAMNGITIDTLLADTADLDAANGSIAIAGNVNVAGLVEANAQDILLRAADDLVVAAGSSAGDIDIAVGGNLDVQGISAAGNVILVSGGSTAVNAALGATTTGLPSGVQGTQQITTTNGGNVTITAGTDIVLNSVVNASGDLTLDAGGLIDIQATVSGVNIETVSADMNIGTSGALGRSDTTSDILITTDGDIALGGIPAVTTTGFTLDNDEFSRIHSGGDLAIVANAGAAGGGNITVDDLDVTVGVGTGTPTDGNIASFGGLFLEAADSVSINGDMTVTGAGADTFVGIDAVNTVAIDVDTGNLRLEDTTGSIAGVLGITADTITAISSAAAADIASGTVADIDIRLGQVDSARPDGYIQADSVSLNVNGSVLIQNSGTGTDFADRAGITAGDLSISAIDPDAAIVINGVVGGAIGIDAIAVTNVPSSFDAASTINGCLIANPVSCGPVVVTPVTPVGPTTPEPTVNPVQDLIDTQVDATTPLPDVLTSVIVEFRENPETRRDPLIDEPVTGAGNDDLWIGEDECAAGDEACFAGGELEPAE